MRNVSVILYGEWKSFFIFFISYFVFHRRVNYAFTLRTENYFKLVQNNSLLSSNGLIVLYLLQTTSPLHCTKVGLHTPSIHSHIKSCPIHNLCCQGYLRPLHHRPVLRSPPPLPPSSPPLSSNACPALTGFVLPTGPWCSTRPGKSYYTGVTALDFPIRDSKRRIRVYYNTGFTAFPPKTHLALSFSWALFLVLAMFHRLFYWGILDEQ